MGLANSKREMNPHNYPAILISKPPSMFSDIQTMQFPTGPEHKPSAISLKDDALWEEFSKKMNEQVPLINKYLGPMSIFFLFIVAMCILLATTGAFYGIQFVIIPAAILHTCTFVAVVSNNQRIDLEIGKIVESYQNRFAEDGIQLEYATKWTGLCKPGYARAMRILLFKPAVNGMP